MCIRDSPTASAPTPSRPAISARPAPRRCMPMRRSTRAAARACRWAASARARTSPGRRFFWPATTRAIRPAACSAPTAARRWGIFSACRGGGFPAGGLIRGRTHQRLAARSRTASGDEPAFASARISRNLLDQFDDAAAQLAVLDLHERLGQRETVGGGEEVRHIGRRGRFAHAGMFGQMRAAFEEKRNRHLQDVGNMLQPAGADAVGALLVFLHLLEGEAEGVAELFLTHFEHHPAHAHARADMLIRQVGYFFLHLARSFPVGPRRPMEQGVQAIGAYYPLTTIT